jgi:ABC-type branched-subunit amino acid transport system substrate-binding protein
MNYLTGGGVRMCAFVLVAAQAALAQNGVKPDRIVIGQCAALSGPASWLGTETRNGLKAAFDEVNAKGGVHGRRIVLESSDDGYEPEKCVDCTAKLLDGDVFALAGYVGTPTAKVAAPIVKELKVPLIGLFTGAMLLRQPVERYVINIRASYDDETEALAGYLFGKGLKKIAVFYQNDSFGQAGLSGTEKALAKRQSPLAAKGSFERNTIAVKSGLATVMGAAPDAVIVVAPYQPAAQFVREARAAGLKAAIATISFVGTENLIAELGAEADGLIISQVVPPPSGGDSPLAAQYRAALQQSAPRAAPTYVSLEGYLNGRVLVAAIEKSGADPTREKLIDAVESFAGMDFGGVKISFSSNNHQGSSTVFLTRVAGGNAQPIQ